MKQTLTMQCNGTLTTVCSQGHRHEIPPIRWNPQTRSAFYSSRADFCSTCEESLEAEVVFAPK